MFAGARQKNKKSGWVLAIDITRLDTVSTGAARARFPIADIV